MLTACDSTVWGGVTYDSSGLYSDTLQSVAGCDSIITLDLTIVSPVTNNVDSTICFGDSALLAGSYQTVSGTYRDTIVGGAANTCDSIVVTALTVSPQNIGDTTVLTACDSTVWGGVTYDSSGLYNDTLPSVAGCDSIITLDLTIVSPVTNNVDSTICFGDSALLAGSYQSVSGTYRDTIVGGASNTCDSIVVTALTVLPQNIGDTTVLVACDSAEWQGTKYTVSGIYNDTLPSAAGCDSIITLDLNISHPPVIDAGLNDTICYGDSVTLASQILWNSNNLQDKPISACIDGSNINIRFNNHYNCSFAPGDLSGMIAIGFHSGANNWSNTVAWDSPGALNAINIGNDIFEVQLDPLVYYGLSQMPTNIGIVYNQGGILDSHGVVKEKQKEMVHAKTSLFILIL